MSPNDAPPVATPRRSAYVYLLAALVIYVIASALAREMLAEWAVFIGDLLLVLILLSGLKSLARSRREMLWLGTLAGLMLVFTAVKTATGKAHVEYAGLITMLVFCVHVAAVVLRDVLFGGPVDLNRLWGAVAVYLLIGLAWAVLYALLDAATAAPLLTDAVDPPSTDGRRDVHAYIYYSFVVLTTLGFGDISPITPVVRALTFLEAAFGQLYLTILIAALVGMVAGKVRRSGDETASN